MKKAIILLTAALIGLGCAGNKKFIRPPGESPDTVVVAGNLEEKVNIDKVCGTLEKYHGGLYRWGFNKDVDNDGVKEPFWIEGGDGTVYYVEKFNYGIKLVVLYKLKER